jgi:hypothetical protein
VGWVTGYPCDINQDGKVGCLAEEGDFDFWYTDLEMPTGNTHFQVGNKHLPMSC